MGSELFQHFFNCIYKGCQLCKGKPGNDLPGHFHMEIMVLFKINMAFGGQFNKV